MEDLDWGLGMNSLEFINKYNVYNMLLLFVFSIILYDVSNYESYVEDEVEVKEDMESVYVFLIYQDVFVNRYESIGFIVYDEEDVMRSFDR